MCAEGLFAATTTIRTVFAAGWNDFKGSRRRRKCRVIVQLVANAATKTSKDGLEWPDAGGGSTTPKVHDELCARWNIMLLDATPHCAHAHCGKINRCTVTAH